MKKVVLDFQSGLYAKAIRRVLVQDLDGYQVDISNKPSETSERCRILQPDVLLVMEVTEYTPWRLSERMAIREQVLKQVPSAKIVLMVDEKTDEALVKEIKKVKQQGLIDAFLFTSIGENYLAAVVDSL